MPRTERAAQAVKYAEALLEARNQTGVLLVADQGEVSVTRVLDSAEGEEPALSMQTPFLIGSVTKLWTALAMVRLSQQGIVDLDAPLSTWFPGVAHWRPIRLRWLLEHRSGMPRTASADYAPKTSEDAVAACAGAELTFPPGSKEHYSNCGYDVAGRILELATGEPLPMAMRRLVLDPLGMSESGIAQPERAPVGLAVGHSKRDGKVVPVRHPAHFTAAGGGYSTAKDLCAFALGAPRLGGEQYAPFSKSHAGRTEGFDSFLSVFPEQGAVIVYLTNRDDGPLARIFEDLKSIVRGEPATPPTVPRTALLPDDVSGFEALSGTFRLDVDTSQVLRIEPSGGKLYLKTSNEVARLRWIGPRKLVLVPSEEEGDSTDSEQYLDYPVPVGKVPYVELRVLGGMVIRATRLEP